MFSEQALRIMKEQKGYRNEELYGSGYRDLKEVISFEILELGNFDVFYTLHDNFPEFATIFPLKQIESLEDIVSEEQDVVVVAISQVVEWIEHILGDNLAVCWMCASKNDVAENYDGNEENILTVQFDRPFLVISDLEEQGSLVASTKFYIQS